jgi:hypothetical protein
MELLDAPRLAAAQPTLHQADTRKLNTVRRCRIIPALFAAASPVTVQPPPSCCNRPRFGILQCRFKVPRATRGLI